MLHETMHLFGFASYIFMNNPAVIDYSLWDKNLFNTNSFIPNSNSTNSLLVGDCVHNCYELNENSFSSIEELKAAVLTNCEGEQDFVFGENSIAPLAGSVPRNGQNPSNSVMGNIISHLNQSCNSYNEDYVMQRFIDPGDNRRELIQDEIDILIKLGYKYEENEECYVALNDNSAFLWNIEGFQDCCFEEFFTCANNTISIDHETLLCNDYTNGNALEITDVGLAWVSQDLASQVSFQTVGNSFEITPTEQGTYYFYYTVKGCDCTLINAGFAVIPVPA